MVRKLFNDCGFEKYTNFILGIELNNQLTKVGKFLSYILRHKPDRIGLSLDTQGWADIDELISRSVASGRSLDRQMLHAVAANDEKKRFTISEDNKRIRAAQGHSHKNVDIDFEPLTPPPLLFHGTAKQFLDSIMTYGIQPRSRHYVHFSLDIDTANKVGRRHGIPIVLRIATVEMLAKGYKFHQADNGIWLTRSVPPEFIQIA